MFEGEAPPSRLNPDIDIDCNLYCFVKFLCIVITNFNANYISSHLCITAS